jgi:hypothetical protein
MRYVPAVLTLALLFTPPALVFAQNWAMQGIEHYFRVEWETGTGRRGPVVSGYVYNTSGMTADRVRLGIDTVDSAGQVTATAIGDVLGTVPPGNRAYFEVPVKNPGPYRVRVLSFDPVGRGN